MTRPANENSSIDRELIANHYGDVVEVINKSGKAPVVLACEHASNFIPAEFENLGLSQQDLNSHIAWDPGAREVALALSENLDAPLVASCISRLVYDCNRPPDSESAIPVKSEWIDIPGNMNITQTDREARVNGVYQPFNNQLAKLLKRKKRQTDPLVLVTLHSFTPVYYEQLRDVQIGILHDADSRMADYFLQSLNHSSDLNVQRNQPYGPQDGVTHTLKVHALEQSIHNVMIEIRNDLLNQQEQIKDITGILQSTLMDSFDKVLSPNQVCKQV